MNALTFIGSLWPGDFSTPVDTSTPHGGDLLDCLGDVVGVEPTGEDQSAARRARRRARPVEHLARTGRGASTRIRSVPNSLVRRASGEPATTALITQRICSATSATIAGVSWPCSCAAFTPARLTVSITRAGQLVAEHTDGEDLGRQPAGDVVDLLRGDLTRRRGEDEADGVGAHGNREERIVLVGDTADLDEHASAKRYRAERGGLTGSIRDAASRRAARRSPRRGRRRSPATRRRARRRSRRRRKRGASARSRTPLSATVRPPSGISPAMRTARS